MSEYFEELKTALQQAIDMEKGIIPTEFVEGMPATTYRPAKEYLESNSDNDKKESN